MNVTLSRVNDRVHLQARNEDGNVVDIDGAPGIGGEGAGFRPMQLVLAALASCATMDLVAILTKQRQRLRDLAITVDGERADATPAPFTAIAIHFDLYGDIDERKATRAVNLAVHRYCSVGAMLRSTAEITATFAVHPDENERAPS